MLSPATLYESEALYFNTLNPKPWLKLFCSKVLLVPQGLPLLERCWLPRLSRGAAHRADLVLSVLPASRHPVGWFRRSSTSARFCGATFWKSVGDF